MSGRDDRSPVLRGGRTGSSVDAFLDQAKKVSPAGSSRGRLIFALDATMSRQPTWDLAVELQARMFETAASLGGIDVQLVYFRGFGECRASSFIAGGEGLARLMTKIRVQGGQTQIAKVLRHARDEVRRQRVGALVFVGDAMEEDPDELAAIAGELGLLGLKAFMFQEGRDARTELVFKDLARLTGGVHASFDSSAPGRLASLLSAAAAYAAGGRAALEKHGGAAASLLLTQMR